MRLYQVEGSPNKTRLGRVSKRSRSIITLTLGHKLGCQHQLRIRIRSCMQVLVVTSMLINRQRHLLLIRTYKTLLILVSNSKKEHLVHNITSFHSRRLSNNRRKDLIQGLKSIFNQF